MLGDGDRGALLETLLTKVRTLPSQPCQVVGMSATISNLPELARWLDAYPFQSDWRPVPLQQYVKIGKDVYSADGVIQRSLPPLGPKGDDSSHLALLCNEVCCCVACIHYGCVNVMCMLCTD